MLPAYGRKTACKLFCKAGGQGWRARLAGKAGGKGCWARLPGKAARRARNPNPVEIGRNSKYF
jgi:hypothetical protein